jgi:hypothetical protein
MKSFSEMGMRPVHANGTSRAGASVTNGKAAASETTSENLPALPRIEPTTMQNGGPDTTAIVLNPQPPSSPPGSAGSRSADSSNLPELLKEGVLATMNIADDSMKELLLRTRGLFANAPEPEIRRLDPETVQTAALCGRTIAEIMKAKIEAMRLLKNEK